MSRYNLLTSCLLALLPMTVPAADEQAVRVSLSAYPGAELQLEARQQPLPQILKQITDTTGVAIHYSELPNALITATCVGTTVKQVLECLFAKKADLIFRYAKPKSKSTAAHRPEEVWVLGTNFGADRDCATAGTATPIAAKRPETDNADKVDNLLELTKNQDPVQRAAAVANLAADRQRDAVSVNHALVSALSDKNAEVRAQALSGLARRESSDAPAALQNALQDSDASVRLMAVDHAGDNIALLQQALSDNDETVRAYAAAKLEAFADAAKTQ